MCKQINSNSFKNEITDKLISYMACTSIAVCVNVDLLMLQSNNWNHFTVQKQMSSDSFKNVTNKMCLQIIHI